jgi:membrane-associated phospholipid phosphatase
MPSLHLSWAWWSVIAIAVVVRGRVWPWLLGLYPLMVGFVVMATGNHYLLDALAGTALAFLAVWLGRPEPRALPAVGRLYPLGLGLAERTHAGAVRALTRVRRERAVATGESSAGR